MSVVAAGSMGRRTDTPNVIGITAALQRPSRCAVPGCGKFHEDPIHMPAGD